MGIIGWVLLGFLAGLIAKAIMPGAERVGFILTTLLGIGGALLGGFLATVLGFGDPIDEFFDLSTWVAAVAGALVILFAWNAHRQAANASSGVAGTPGARIQASGVLCSSSCIASRSIEAPKSWSSPPAESSTRMRHPTCPTLCEHRERGPPRRRPPGRVVPRLDRARRRRASRPQRRRARRETPGSSCRQARRDESSRSRRSTASFRSHRAAPRR